MTYDQSEIVALRRRIAEDRRDLQDLEKHTVHDYARGFHVRVSYASVSKKKQALIVDIRRCVRRLSGLTGLPHHYLLRTGALHTDDV